MGKMEGMGMFQPQDKKDKKNIKAEDEVMDGNHFDKLYDQDEDAAGVKFDEGTGKFINNSPKIDGADEELSELEVTGESEDIMGKVVEEEDAAAKWLREHGDDLKEAA